jgi:predicted Rossmann fold flavoprotein
MTRQILVVGGGAAGFFGAIAAAEAHPDVRVTLLEAGSEPLAKVRISGGGRCNVTHACFDPVELVKHYPRGGRELRGPFSRFQPRDTIAWFEQRGVRLKTEADGRIFPTSDDSATIVHCLQQAAQTAGVRLWTRAPVTRVQAKDASFVLHLKGEQLLTGDRLLLATGSSPQGYRLAASLGHSIIPPVPSLFTFNIPDPTLTALAGVSLTSVRLTLGEGKQRLEQQGPLLVTHWGISGPAVLKLSAWGARYLHDCGYRTQLQINWLPAWPATELRQWLQEQRQQTPRKQLQSLRPEGLPQRFWTYLLARVGLDSTGRWSDLSNRDLNALLEGLTRSGYLISGKSAFKEEFVTAGGVALREVDFRSLESRLCPGLHFAGELLNIDGVTGGFNFQNAWTTGWLAGQAMANQICGEG